MLLSKCAVFDSKNSKFVNGQEASGLLISLGIKTHLSKITLVGFLVLIVSNKLIKCIKWIK